MELHRAGKIVALLNNDANTMRNAGVKMRPHQKHRSEQGHNGADRENGRPILLLLSSLSFSVALLALVGMDDQRGAILMLAAAVVYAAIRLHTEAGDR